MSQTCPAVVCLGFFDGVHIGHRALIDAARREADARGWLVRAHTFDRAPSPRGVELTSAAERVALLLEAGADDVRVSRFDDAMRLTDGVEFFKNVVLCDLQARHVVCGSDHRFGHLGASGAEELRALCDAAGIGLTIVDDVKMADGQKVSSTRIRRAIAEGDLALAAAMLGRQPPPSMIDRVLSPETFDNRA